MTTTRGGDEILLAFARALRAGGVPVTQDRAHGFLEAAALLGADDPAAVRTAGRSTLCAGPDDLARFDQVFEAFFNDRQGLPRLRPAGRPEPGPPPPPRGPGGPPDPPPTHPPLDAPAAPGGGRVDEDIRAAASTTEVLRHRD